MCIKRSRDPGDSSGGSARIMPTASASSVDDAAVARDRCVQESEVRCATLDEALPWQAHRVGLILLDVEGHAEAAALEGAAEVIKVEANTRIGAKAGSNHAGDTANGR